MLQMPVMCYGCRDLFPDKASVMEHKKSCVPIKPRPSYGSLLQCPFCPAMGKDRHQFFNGHVKRNHPERWNDISIWELDSSSGQRNVLTKET